MSQKVQHTFLCSENCNKPWIKDNLIERVLNYSYLSSLQGRTGKLRAQAACEQFGASETKNKAFRGLKY